MRKLGYAFAGCTIMVFAMVLGACSSKSADDGLPISLSRTPEQAEAKRDEVEKQNRAILYTQIRGQNMKEIRAAFAEDTNPVESATPWRDAVRNQERPQIFGEICRGLDRFDNMERAFRLMSGNDDPITWEELEIEAGDAGKMYRDTGIRTAKLLIKILEIPRADRKLVSPCYEGKGSWNFADEEVVGNRIIEILDAIHPGASDVGMTSGELRQLLIKELTQHIAELRESVAAEAATQEDVDNCLYDLFMAAKTSWNIPFDQLGIAHQEHAMIKERTAADKTNAGNRWCSEEVNLTLPRQE